MEGKISPNGQIEILCGMTPDEIERIDRGLEISGFLEGTGEWGGETFLTNVRQGVPRETKNGHQGYEVGVKRGNGSYSLMIHPHQMGNLQELPESSFLEAAEDELERTIGGRWGANKVSIYKAQPSDSR